MGYPLTLLSVYFFYETLLSDLPRKQKKKKKKDTHCSVNELDGYSVIHKKGQWPMSLSLFALHKSEVKQAVERVDKDWLTTSKFWRSNGVDTLTQILVLV